LPLLLASALLILRKGPRLVAATGFLTGFGLAWTVLIIQSAVACLTFERGPGRFCDPGDVGPFLVTGAVVFVAGLAASALVLSRRPRRP
jgi:hypothetical protein